MMSNSLCLLRIKVTLRNLKPFDAEETAELVVRDLPKT